MTLPEMLDLYEKHAEHEYRKWERVTTRRCPRPDLHAMLLLEELVPWQPGTIPSTGQPMFIHFEHRMGYVGVSPLALAKVVTEAQLVELCRCGLCIDHDTDQLYFFV